MAQIAAVILAAGQSSRFGAANKLCAQVDDAALIHRVVATALDAGITDVVVVTGQDRAQVEQAVGDLPVRIVHNPDWANGMGTSIAAGVIALGNEIDGAFIVPGDMPFLHRDVFRTLITVFQQNQLRAPVYAATTSGEQRNPVLWPQRYFGELGSLSGHEGAKTLLASAGTAAVGVPFGDEIVFADVDTPDDLAQANREADRSSP